MIWVRHLVLSIFRSGDWARSLDIAVLGNYRRHTARHLALAKFCTSLLWSNIELDWCCVDFFFTKTPEEVDVVVQDGGSSGNRVRATVGTCTCDPVPPADILHNDNCFPILLRVANMASVVAVSQLRPPRQYENISRQYAYNQTWSASSHRIMRYDTTATSSEFCLSVAAVRFDIFFVSNIWVMS